MNGAIHGLKRKYVSEKMDEIVSFAELEDFIDVPVRTYSAGMYMRLGFSIAAHIDPDVLLLDEVFAVGDESFQRKCMGKILDLKQRGRTLLFVSHSAPAVERLCERAMLLNAGELVPTALLGMRSPVPADAGRGGESCRAQCGSPSSGAPARRVSSRSAFEDGNGEERRQFLSGQALAIRLRIAADKAIPPPRITIEFRDANGSLLGVSEVEAEELGWDGSPGTVELLFSSSRLPLADGRFQLSVALSRPDSARQFHRLDPAVEFTVFPDADQRGWFRFEGSWSLVSTPSALERR